MALISLVCAQLCMVRVGDRGRCSSAEGCGGAEEEESSQPAVKGAGAGGQGGGRWEGVKQCLCAPLQGAGGCKHAPLLSQAGRRLLSLHTSNCDSEHTWFVWGRTLLLGPLAPQAQQGGTEKMMVAIKANLAPQSKDEKRRFILHSSP